MSESFVKVDILLRYSQTTVKEWVKFDKDLYDKDIASVVRF